MPIACSSWSRRARPSRVTWLRSSNAWLPIRGQRSASSSTWRGRQIRDDGIAVARMVAGPSCHRWRFSVRIAHIVSQFHPGLGSTETFVLKLARQQRLAGVNAEVVTLNRLLSNPTSQLSAYDCVQGVPVRRIGYVGSSKYPLALDILA